MQIYQGKLGRVCMRILHIVTCLSIQDCLNEYEYLKYNLI